MATIITVVLCSLPKIALPGQKPFLLLDLCVKAKALT